MKGGKLIRLFYLLGVTTLLLFLLSPTQPGTLANSNASLRRSNFSSKAAAWKPLLRAVADLPNLLSESAADSLVGYGYRKRVHDTTTASRAFSVCERGRVWIVNNHVVADNGYPLRGERDLALADYGYDLSWGELAGTYHLNAIRIFLYQEPQNFSGGCGYDCPGIPPLEENIQRIDGIVDQAAQNGFYVIIDYHPVGGYVASHAFDWWSAIAPRYKDRSHVIYELVNEPVAWSPTDYEAEDIAFEESLYAYVRSLAPDTHIIVWSFAHGASGMLDKVSQGTSISYDNASVGFHTYGFDRRAYDELHAAYPVINTEIGAESLYEYRTRTTEAEAVGVSWIWLDAVKHPGEIDITWPGDPLALFCADATPRRLEAEDYKDGGESIAYHDTTPGNAGGEYRYEDVDIESTEDSGGGYDVGWIEAGEWLAFDIFVSYTGLYDFTTRVASNISGVKTFHFEVDGEDVTGPISFTDASGWQSWLDVAVTDVSLSAGMHELRIVFDTASFNLNYVEISPPVIGPRVSQMFLPLVVREW